MNSNDLNWAAGELLTAQSLIRAREPLANRFPEITLLEGYQIQKIGQNLRMADGARQIGWKMGLTSESKRKQMNLHSSIYGYLLDVGALKGDEFDFRTLIHPKVECEIGFRMKTGLKGKISQTEARAAIASAHAAFEIIDSRYIGFKYFSLPDVVADNCSAGRFVFGEACGDISKVDLENLQMTLVIDGKEAQKNRSNEISGNPINSICELSALLELNGDEIRAGDWILAGAAGPAIELKPHQNYQLKIDSFPMLSFKTGA